jgi:hypothetical protein
MGRVFDEITDEIASFVGAQPLFFVATAPSGSEGHVNCSPKGLDTFTVLGPNAVAYLDLTGSGAETIAHLRDNGRITIMFCAFDGKPNIVRLYGHGQVIEATQPEAQPFLDLFPTYPGARAIITVDVDRVSTSCGYAVPKLRLDAERPTLLEWATRKGEDGLRTYRAEQNARSVDGLPALGELP